MNAAWKEAVQQGSVAELKRLLASGADINMRDEHGQTALMNAARSGHTELVRWLIERGADLDHTAKFGLSALMLAVINGHVDIVRALADAGADTGLRGTGAPAFAGKTALDLAAAGSEPGMVQILERHAERAANTDNPHFSTAPSWKAARAMLCFEPRRPSHTAGLQLQYLRIHVRDHRLRDLPMEQRTLESHYGDFVLSQSRPGADEAHRQALVVSYGPQARPASIAGHSARVYELGPETAPDDIDGRAPAVVTWHEADRFYLIASDKLPADALVRIAESLYR